MKTEGTHARSNVLSAPVADLPTSQVTAAEDDTAKRLLRISASMLVEPFVEHMAGVLRQSMDAAMLRGNSGLSTEIAVKSL